MTRWLDLLIWLSFFGWLWYTGTGHEMAGNVDVVIIALFVADIMKLLAQYGRSPAKLKE